MTLKKGDVMLCSLTGYVCETAEGCNGAGRCKLHSAGAPIARSVDERPEAVNHPKHYNEHPSGVECITVVEHMGFNLGNAVKYVWRADLKADAIEDLKKARWYIEREIQRREKSA